MLDDGVWSDILLDAFSLYAPVYEHVVKQVELRIANHYHSVDSLGPVNLDFSMFAG